MAPSTPLERVDGANGPLAIDHPAGGRRPGISDIWDITPGRVSCRQAAAVADLADSVPIAQTIPLERVNRANDTLGLAAGGRGDGRGTRHMGHRALGYRTQSDGWT